MRFLGVHRIWQNSGWLLSYGLKGVSAAMVAGSEIFYIVPWGKVNCMSGCVAVVQTIQQAKKADLVQCGYGLRLHCIEITIESISD